MATKENLFLITGATGNTRYRHRTLPELWRQLKDRRRDQKSAGDWIKNQTNIQSERASAVSSRSL